MVSLIVKNRVTRFDSLSVVPGSIELTGLPDTAIDIDPFAATITVTDTALLPAHITLKYVRFPIDFYKVYAHKDTALITDPVRVYNPFRSDVKTTAATLDLGELDKSGSISRGITVGNNQNLSVNSSLNLQLSGRLNERFSIQAALADDNIPIQPDGNTQQIQDFDQVYIRIFDENNTITGGDFQAIRTSGYFMKYNKRLQGARIESFIGAPGKDSATRVAVDVAGALSRGKFARKTIQGVEGNQGPYRLTGAEGEPFIIILSGTERVYVDGKLLTRGQENDYVINYNTAEITFTARQPINKDRRIIVEFQYSDRNYARSLLFSNIRVDNNRGYFEFAAYSEQDAKNQPLQQDLTEAQKSVLRAVGDSLHLAVAPTVAEAEYSDAQLLYVQRDTVYFDPELGDSVLVKNILVYSPREKPQMVRATFSDVGPGNGNYVVADQLALGRTYKWVAPVNGKPQGRYEPVILLITPKQRQMVSLSGQYSLNRHVKAFVEWAGSNNDLNTFSTLDKSDDLGMGGKLTVEGVQPLNSNWDAIAAVDYEHVSKNFAEIERFRSVEFDRDWNIRDKKIGYDQNLIGLKTGLRRGSKLSALYGFRLFDAGKDFAGIQHAVDISADNRWAQGGFSASLTNQDGNRIVSDYYQHNTSLAIPFWKLALEYKDDFERNVRLHPTFDTVLNTSFQWWEWEVALATADTFRNKYRVSYAERTNQQPHNNDFALATHAQMYGFEMALNRNENSQWLSRVNYRNLEIINPALTNLKPEKTLLTRHEYRLRLLRGAVSSSSFYELGSGLENRREFIYIETTPGLGTHIHIDYNQNGIKELNEFEQAFQPDQVASANYIKVFIPTNDYVRTYTTMFSQSLYLRPAAVWRTSSGIRKGLSHFSNVFSYSLDRKNLELPAAQQFNPFFIDVADSLLQSVNNNFRNILYFNQSHPIFGADLNYQLVEGRQLLTNGFESRRLEKTGAGLRWNFTNDLGTELRAEQGFKVNTSDAGVLSQRNYRIFFQSIEPRINIQPGTMWRLSLIAGYKEQTNLISAVGSDGASLERSIMRKAGTEFMFSSPEKGNLTVSLTLTELRFNGHPSSASGYELLEGLQPGLNSIWGVSYQRSLAGNLQVSFNYNGRLSPGIPVIHTGGVQARAFF
ncbi:MAG: hypothetical protein Kow0075_01520 [Salibacteraceae bacterium]